MFAYQGRHQVTSIFWFYRRYIYRNFNFTTADVDLETSLEADEVGNVVSESTFEIIYKGTERALKKLVESNGFMYRVKKV